MDTDPLYYDEAYAAAHEVRRHWSRRRCIRCTRFGRAPGGPDPLDALHDDPDADGTGGNDGMYFGLPPIESPFKRLLNGGNEIEFYPLPRGRASGAWPTRATPTCALKEGKSGAMLLVDGRDRVHHRGGRAAARQPADADLEMSDDGDLHIDDVAVGQRVGTIDKGRDVDRAHHALVGRGREFAPHPLRPPLRDRPRQAAGRADQRLLEAARAGAARQGQPRARPAGCGRSSSATGRWTSPATRSAAAPRWWPSRRSTASDS